MGLDVGSYDGSECLMPDRAPHTRACRWNAVCAEKLKSTDLEAQSKLIQAHNEKTKEDLKEDWQDIFARIFDGLPPAAEVHEPLDVIAEASRLTEPRQPTVC